MTPIHAREAVLIVGARAVIHTVDALHRAIGVRDTSKEYEMPPLSRRFSEPAPAPWADPHDDLTKPPYDDDEARPSMLLATQLRGWLQENSDRGTDLETMRSSSSTWPPPLDAALLTMPLFPPPKNADRRVQIVNPACDTHSRSVSVYRVS